MPRRHIISRNSEMEGGSGTKRGMKRRPVSVKRARSAMRKGGAYAACGFPADSDCIIPKVSVTGDRWVRVEHHEGVLVLSERSIRLVTALGVLRIEGAGLCASVLTEDELIADGRIRSVSFE